MKLQQTHSDEELVTLLKAAHDQDRAIIESSELALPKPNDFKSTLSLKLTTEAEEAIEHKRTKIRDAIDGRTNAKLLIIGPCSPDFKGLDDGKIPAVIEFARRIKPTIEQIEKDHNVIVIMRTPAVKPRTAVGWGGIFPESPTATRILFTAMANEGIPLASEVYGQFQQDYLSDLCVLTWVGARNVTAPNTRTQVAESVTPVLVKHGLTEVDSSVNARSVIAAKQPASHIDWETGRLTIRVTRGNPHTLTILRGYELDGKHISNITAETILKVSSLSKEANLPQGVVIDISHSNGNKSVEGSLAAFDKVEQLLNNKEVGSYIRGIMVESYIGGKGDGYGESATDPTIDIDRSVELMRQFASHCELKEEDK